ncbi:MAG: plasmid maintenance system killer [Chloroflexi bacterium]|nr:plasmid maintenance system killer [Chloroflexota bacterium]
MQVRFHTRRLERCAGHLAAAVRAWGPEVGRRYIERVQLLQEAPGLEALYDISTLRLHPLRGDRRGQFAMRLTGRMRLIVESGLEEGSVTVVEVVDYHE